MKNLFIILLFCFSLNGFGHDYYIDVVVEEEYIDFLDKIDKTSEKGWNPDYPIFDKFLIPNTTSESNEAIINKKKNKKNRTSSIRIYIRPYELYDTLTITGFGWNYEVKIQEDKVINAPLWVVSLANYERGLDSIDYVKLTEVLHQQIIKYYQSKNEDQKFPIAEYNVLGEYKILRPSFYLFTCPEVYHYENPIDTNTIFTHDTTKFIEGNYVYENFPAPEQVVFKLTLRPFHGDLPVNGKPPSNTFMSNYNLIIDYDYVGLVYVKNDKKKTFWATKKYIFNYLWNYKVFKMSMNLFFVSAIGDSLKPLSD